jgi:Zn-dependent M28 family amino/carboxypeptidase
VIGYINNHAKQTIILCAHYDHLGYGSGRSRELIKKNVVHPGADDNASGVALMLELAKWTRKHQHSYNYIFLASSAHELGLYGARYFLRSGFVSANSVAAVFNFDMVGRLNTNYPTLKVSTTDSSAGRQAILESQKDSLHLRFDNDIENDFTAFKEAGFKTYSFTTGTHDDYHRSGDRPERINYTGLETIARFMKRVLLHWQ